MSCRRKNRSRAQTNSLPCRVSTEPQGIVSVSPRVSDNHFDTVPTRSSMAYLAVLFGKVMVEKQNTRKAEQILALVCSTATLQCCWRTEKKSTKRRVSSARWSTKPSKLSSSRTCTFAKARPTPPPTRAPASSSRTRRNCSIASTAALPSVFEGELKTSPAVLRVP